MSHFATLTFAATLAAFGAAGAAAQPAPQAPAQEQPNALTTLLPHQPGRALCYVSSGAPVTFPVEDIPERKQPRHVTINRFLFELKSVKDDDDDTATPPTPGRIYHGYRLLAEVKGEKRRLFAAGECSSKDLKGFWCGVECDGGVMDFEPLRGGESLAMRVSDVVHRFRMTWGCGEEEEEAHKYEVLRYDPAIPAVRLDKADAKECAPIAREVDRRK